ncbi:glycosyltransferase family 4 protein [candidate division WOR-3 bacterium]|nr:glycosyltransferase family 4 protein [candidate division WOR-3 bacterium]
MKVLFVTTAYKRHAQDVITPWMVELIQRLRARGVDITVFTSSYKGLKNQVLDGVPIIRFRYFFKRFERLTHEENAVDRLSRGPWYLMLSCMYLLCGSIALVRLTRAQRYDIVHINWPFPHIIFGIIARCFGRARIFVTFYGLEIRWLKKKFRSLIRVFSVLVNRANMISAISNHTARELSDITDKPIPIVPFSTPIQEKPGMVSDNKIILFVGRSVERKGVDNLIRAYGQIKDKISHCLVIVGDGPERKKWQELAHAIDTTNRIELTGWITNQELSALYRTCSFFVLPAVYDKHGDTEGLGVVMIEAMSYCKPVIASNVGGITDVVDDGHNGILVPAGDIPALAEALMKLATNDALRREMGKRAKQTVDEKFNWDTIVNHVIRLYKQTRGSI